MSQNPLTKRSQSFPELVGGVIALAGACVVGSFLIFMGALVLVAELVRAAWPHMLLLTLFIMFVQ